MTARRASSPGTRWPGRGAIPSSFCAWPPRVHTRGPAWPGTPPEGASGRTSGGPPCSGHTRELLWVLGGGVPPRAALAAKSVRSGLLGRLDLVAEARQASPLLAEAGCCRLSHHRQHCVGRPLEPAFLEACAGLCPAQPTGRGGDPDPLIQASSSSRSFYNPPLPFPI